jgi:hypothetical protein
MSGSDGDSVGGIIAHFKRLDGCTVPLLENGFEDKTR